MGHVNHISNSVMIERSWLNLYHSFWWV